MWKICYWIHILAWTNRSCIVIHKSLMFNGSQHYVQHVPYAAILQSFLLFSMIWYCRIQSPAESKQQDKRWCGFRWLIPLSIDYVCIPVLIGLSRLLHAHIAYEIDSSKIIAAFCRFSYCLHDLIRLHSIVCHVQTTWCKMLWFSMIDSDINCLCLNCVYW